jgi:hypothetical protein
MDIENTSKEVLKGLILQYKQSKDSEVFEQILSRVDKLIEYEVFLLRQKCPHLRREDKQDLYQTAILGLYTAINYVNEEDSPSIVPAKLVVYMKAEIKKTYPNAIITCGSPEDLEVPEKGAFDEVEYNEIREVLDGLVNRGIIEKRDLDFLEMKFSLELTLKEISKLSSPHVTEECVRRRIQKTLNKIRYEFRKTGII